MPTNERTLEDLQEIVDYFEKIKKLIPTLKKHIGQQKRQIAWNKEGRYGKTYKYGKKVPSPED